MVNYNKEIIYCECVCVCVCMVIYLFMRMFIILPYAMHVHTRKKTCQK